MNKVETLSLNGKKYQVYNLTGDHVDVYLKTITPQPPFLSLPCDGKIREAIWTKEEKVKMTVQISTSLGKLPTTFALSLKEFGVLKYETHLYPNDLTDKAIIVNENIARRLSRDKSLPQTIILVQMDKFTLDCYQFPPTPPIAEEEV